jgi:virginiamycin B lyase
MQTEKGAGEKAAHLKQAPSEQEAHGLGGKPVQPDAPRVPVHRPSRSALRRRAPWLLLGATLLLMVTFFMTTHQGETPPQRRSAKSAPVAALATTGTFRIYPFPQADSEAMRPALDQQGRLWFGAIGQNALVVFDPRTRRFQYLRPPGGEDGVTGVVVAPDETIWFAEQAANYLGHYLPATGQFRRYPLPRITTPDPSQPGRLLSLPSGPNELALDRAGDLWFTEFSADRLGRLDPRTGQIRQYALSARSSVLTLYPYGITIDQEGMVWFTESGTNRLGRLDPLTGALRLFSAPDPQARLMEVTSDGQGSLWTTTLTPPGLLYHFTPATGTFTSYRAPVRGPASSALYGLLVTPTGAVWVTMLAENALACLDVKARRFVSYHIPTPDSEPLGLVMDNSHAIWFTGVTAVGVLVLRS